MTTASAHEFGIFTAVAVTMPAPTSVSDMFKLLGEGDVYKMLGEGDVYEMLCEGVVV